MSAGVRKVSHGAGKVSHGAGKVLHGAGKVSHGARKMSHGIREVSHGVRNVSGRCHIVTGRLHMVPGSCLMVPGRCHMTVYCLLHYHFSCTTFQMSMFLSVASQNLDVPVRNRRRHDNGFAFQAKGHGKKYVSFIKIKKGGRTIICQSVLPVCH